MLDLFDTSDFPARWTCGNWSPELGWLHIISDLLIWGAYLAIPIVLVYFTRRRRDIPFQTIFLLFGAFIVACGTTHLIEAIIFYQPVYRLAGVVKLFTALVSWGTVLALFRVVPQALAMKTPGQLEAEVAARTAELKTANEALEASEARFRDLTEAMPQLVWAVGPDHRATYLNTRWKEYTGQTEAGPDAAAWLLHPDDVDRVSAAWRAAHASGSVYQAEYRLRAKTGEYRWFLGRGVQVRRPDGTTRGWLGTSTDIEDLKRAETAARESQRYFRQLTESLPQLVWTDRPDGYCDYLGPQWVRYTGIPAEEQLGYGWANQLHPDDRARATAAWNQAVATGTDFDVEFRIRRADGVYRWFQTRAVPLRDEAGAIVKWFGTNTDIDDLKRAEADLRESRGMLQLVLDNIPQGVVWKDRDSRYLGCNAVVARAVGLRDPAAIVGRRDADLPGITPEQAAFFVEKDQAVMAADVPESHIVEPMTLPDGRTMWLDTTKVPLHDQDGRVIGLLATWEDITIRRLAEQALRESEARFHRTFDSMLEGCQIIGFDWRFLYVNESVAAHARIPRAEMLGRTLMEVFPGIERTEMFAAFRRCMDERTPARFENRFEYPDGHAAWFDLSIQPGPEGIFVLSADITERKQAEHDLARQRAELQLILDTVPALIFFKDRAHRLVRANAAMARLIGLPKEALEGRTDEELGSPHAERYRQDEDEIFSTGQAKHDLVEPLYTQDGTRWLQTDKVPYRDDAGAIVGIVGFAIDITERQAAEEALRKSESRFRGAFENTNVAMVLTDLDNRFIRVNRAFSRLFGYTPAELLTMTLADLTHPDHLAESLANREPLMAGTADFFEMEKRYVHKAGHVLWGRTNVSVVRDPGGRPLLYVGQVQDITERKAAEEEIRRLNAELEGRVRARTAELEAANKELEAFSYSVSHDLRAPLRAIDGYSRIILRDYAAEMPEDAREYMADVRRNAQQMGQLVDDLLAFSRLGRKALRVQRVDIPGLVRECLDEIRPPASAKVRVSDLPPVTADRALLKQVWVNLLSNALKYAGKRETPVVEVGAADGPDGPVYFVKDNGVGFDMRYAHKLFGVFQRLHKAEDYEGTGVGLATVQRIIHRHGGRVWAESEPDRGATFFFTLGPDGAALLE
jgi:PAS domain S-box-containing protein